MFLSLNADERRLILNCVHYGYTILPLSLLFTAAFMAVQHLVSVVHVSRLITEFTG